MESRPGHVGMGEAGTFETNFVDLNGVGGLLGQASGRTKKTVTQWLDGQGQECKDAVEVVAIDPYATYRRAVQEALPNALIVADHFHVSRLGNKTVTDVRQRVVRETAGRRGRATDPIWAGRRRLLRAVERLTPKAYEAMVTDLTENDPTGQILIAWVRKKNYAPYSPPPKPVVNVTTSLAAWTGSTPGARDPEPTSAKFSASPQPSKRGGPKSWASYTPTSPTQQQREPTTSSKTPPGAPSASATWQTSAVGYGGHVHAANVNKPRNEDQSPLTSKNRIESSEQRGRAVPLVVAGGCARPALGHRQRCLGAVHRLN